MNNFHNIPKDEDTRILGEGETKLNGFNIKFEIWSWDGIQGNSLIFKTSEIKHLEDEEIIEMVKSSDYCNNNSQTTITKADSDLTFVNFNFEMIDD